MALVLLLLLIVAAAGHSKHHGSKRAGQGTPGVFDYYLLTLSWSPEFCRSHVGRSLSASRDIMASWYTGSGRSMDGYPENCSNAPGLANPGEMTDIMPDAGLGAHEWSTHGTCSGMDAESYFKLLRRAFDVDRSTGKVCYCAGGALNSTGGGEERVSSSASELQRRGNDCQLRQQRFPWVFADN